MVIGVFKTVNLKNTKSVTQKVTDFLYVNFLYNISQI